MLPYDGSPDGNALGMQFDEERRRNFDETIAAAQTSDNVPQTSVQMIASLLGLGVFLVVIFFAAAG